LTDRGQLDPFVHDTLVGTVHTGDPVPWDAVS
jgi:hypothetical protein